MTLKGTRPYLESHHSEGVDVAGLRGVRKEGRT